MKARHWIHISALMAVLAAATLAQTADDELARLRKHLSLPDSYPVTAGSTATLQVTDPFKLYIATGLDTGVHNNLVRWFDEWNQKNARKYVTIQIVDDLNSADFIIARYRITDSVQSVSNTRTVVIPSSVYDPASGKMVTRPVPITRSGSTSVVPVYAYILMHDPDGLKIVYRYTDVASLAETKDNGMQLRDAVFGFLKRRRH